MTGAMLALPDASFAPTMPFTEIPRTQRDGDKFSQRQARPLAPSADRMRNSIRREEAFARSFRPGILGVDLRALSACRGPGRRLPPALISSPGSDFSKMAPDPERHLHLCRFSNSKLFSQVPGKALLIISLVMPNHGALHQNSEFCTWFRRILGTGGASPGLLTPGWWSLKCISLSAELARLREALSASGPPPLSWLLPALGPLGPGSPRRARRPLPRVLGRGLCPL
ncbi:Fibroblast Growth Factor 8 [Manis pentadactyla]|nr:Fibroblast Growth Factor 8 [Manis pentadactyla]